MNEEERNVEIVRSSIEAIDAHDIDRTLEHFSDDVVFDGSRAMEGVYEGKNSYRRFLTEMLGSLDEFGHRNVSLLSGGGRVVALTSLAIAGRASGAPGDARIAYLYELRDGLIVRQEVHPDGEALLRSLGLEQ